MATTKPNTPPRRVMVVTVVLSLCSVALMTWTLYNMATLDRGMVIHRLESDTSKLASTLFFDKMTALAQLTMALLGAAWALLTLADTATHVKGWPTITCFILANLSFAFSLGVYVYGYDFIIARVFYHATFDIDAPFIKFVSASQQFLFLKGCVDLGFTIILGRQTS